MRFIIDIDDETVAEKWPTGDPVWRLTRVVLEGVETGASRHCLARDFYPGGAEVCAYRHHRLGVKVEVDSL